MITPETQIYLSLALQPGRFGTRFFNHFFAHYAVDAIYRACLVERTQLAAALAGFRALGIRGGGVSMPFKTEALALVDQIDDTVRQVGALNTIVNRDGRLYGYNTDMSAALHIVQSLVLPVVRQLDNVVVFGAGATAQTLCYALWLNHIHEVTLVVRNPDKAKVSLPAYMHSYRMCSFAEWAQSTKPADLLINCTPLGMREETPCVLEDRYLRTLQWLIDLPMSLTQQETSLVRQARALGVNTVSGRQFALLQAAMQFKHYTGKEIASTLLADFC